MTMTASPLYLNQLSAVQREPHVLALVERIVPIMRAFGPIQGVRLVDALSSRLPGEPDSNVRLAVNRLPIRILDGGDVVINENEIHRVLPRR